MTVFSQGYLAEPYKKIAAITPSDTTLLGQYATTPGAPIKGLYVLTTGNLAVILSQDGTTATTLPVTAGQILYMTPKKVMSTNTTATVVALY